MAAKKKIIPLLVLLVLLSSVLLALILLSANTAAVPSPFLIAATIVSTVALFGAVFSLYIEKRARERIQQTHLTRRR